MGRSRRFRSIARGPAPTGTGGWIWVVFSKDPEKRRAAAKFVLDIEAPRNAARISEGTGRLARATERLSRLPSLPGGAVRVLRSDAERGPGAAGRADLQRDLARAADWQSATPSKAREHLSEAVDDAWRVVVAEDTERRTNASQAHDVRSAGVDPGAAVGGVLLASR